VPLKLNGRTLCLHKEKPSIVAVRQFLQKAPADELFTADEVARRAFLNHDQVRRIARDLDDDITHRVGCIRYFGSPKAIAALRKQVEEGM
jgi:hypothetical protein